MQLPSQTAGSWAAAPPAPAVPAPAVPAPAVPEAPASAAAPGSAPAPAAAEPSPPAPPTPAVESDPIAPPPPPPLAVDVPPDVPDVPDVEPPPVVSAAAPPPAADAPPLPATLASTSVLVPQAASARTRKPIHARAMVPCPAARRLSRGAPRSWLKSCIVLSCCPLGATTEAGAQARPSTIRIQQDTKTSAPTPKLASGIGSACMRSPTTKPGRR